MVIYEERLTQFTRPGGLPPEPAATCCCHLARDRYSRLQQHKHKTVNRKHKTQQTTNNKTKNKQLKQNNNTTTNN